MYISLRTELYASQCEEDCSLFFCPHTSTIMKLLSTEIFIFFPITELK